MTERSLARVVKIDSLHPIEGADRVEIAMVGGWQVVVQKGLHQAGNKAVYFEVDSMLPTEHPAFASLTNLSSKLLFEINGKGYARIKTAKIRKQLSQGFIVPLSDLDIAPDADVGNDLTKVLGILKYESKEERSMNNAGTKTGTQGNGTRTFPSFIPKTDQNRVQNIVPRYQQSVADGEMFEKTFKLDGSSMTVWVKDGELGVASRNVGFSVVPKKRTVLETIKHWWKTKRWEPLIPAANNAFTQMAKNAGVLDALKEYHGHTGRNIAIQGEMVGPSIQKNFEGVDSNQFYIYDVFLIDEQEYMLPTERMRFIKEYGLEGVPLAGVVRLPEDYKDAILDADGPSGLNGKYREGFVYKSMVRDFSFKVISNRYLLKEA